MANSERQVARSELVKAHASRLGFSFCGIAKAESLTEHRSFYESFIRRKGHQTFSYLETNLEKRLNPFQIMPDARSVIAVLLNYYPANIIPEDDTFVISRYAYGKDYHSIMKKTNDLVNFIKEEYGNINARAFVDSAAVLEKVWAQRCGVGWQGKNTLLINKAAGSFFFIGIILTNLEIEPDQPEPDHCGTCDKCRTACPTGALETPYHLNISKCISYHTIENKLPVPEELKGKFNHRIYGCDICQDVCPYNKFALPSNEPAFTASNALLNMRKKDWIALTEKQFDDLFTDSAIARTGYKKFIENIRFVAGG